jgi:hypothetical protein
MRPAPSLTGCGRKTQPWRRAWPRSVELRAWRASAASVRGEALAGALDRMMPILVEHTASEEERAMPLIDQHITPTEWGDMFASAVADLPPAEMPVLMGMLMYESGLRNSGDSHHLPRRDA